MFKIKTKVFLPLFILIIGIAGYLYGVWIPETTAFSVRQSQQLVMRTLEIVEDQITQDIVDGRKDEAIDRLDLILLKNPQWTKLVLVDEKGEIIFPQMGNTDLTEGGALRLVSKKLDAYGKDIGMLHVLYDFTEIETTIGEHTSDLMFLFGGLLTFFVGITALTLHFFVIRPAKILAESAQKIAAAKTMEEADVVVLPKATKDEIGKLVQSFADMKNTIRRKQNHLMNKNNELLMAKAKAEEANIAKSQFLANMSHELRTPMNGILGLAGLLAESHMEEDQQESVNAILRSGETLMYLLNDILDFSKIEAGELILENIPFDIQEKMQNVVSLLRPMASKNGNVVGFSFAESTPRYVIGDPARVCQIITNLVGNALKFTERGRVDLIVSVVRSTGESLFYQITVKDTGIGIPKDKQDKLFNKFVQADTSTSRKFGGTGLGLAICKELVDLMKGTIDLESEVGKGTSITVTIPLVEAKASQIPQKAQSFVEKDVRSEQETDYSEFNLLVVDDHHVNMMFNRKLLKRMGFRGVDEATNGLDACKMYESFSDKYHMILMDCQMPEMDGFEATRRIREYQKARNLRQVPIIAMTAHAMQGDKELCLEAGMDDYISKPINPAKLHETLGKWLSMKKKPAQDVPERSNVVGIDAKKNKISAKSLSPKKSTTGSGHHAAAEAIKQAEGKLVDFFYIDCFAEGNPEQERTVLAVFSESAESIIAQLHKILRGEKAEEDWRKTNHKLKGLFVQIGAEKLGKICAQSEKMTDSSLEEKRQIVTEIEGTYQAVLKALSEYVSRPR